MPLDPEKLRRTLRHVISLLVQGEYNRLEAFTGGQRLPASEIQQAVRDWPYRLVMPPDDHLETLVNGEVIEGEGAEPVEYAVDANLFTAEEGRSDLTLSLWLREVPGDLYGVEIEDLHVL